MKLLTESMDELAVKATESFSVELSEPTTAGYRWQLLPTIETVRLERERLKPGKGFGGAGKRRFVFRPVSQGRTTISFELRRPWEQSATKRKDFCVNVGAL